MYHSTCIRIGPPFKTRHFGTGTRGIQYPPCATNLPFICELCTTRAQLNRELDAHLPTDTYLLKLERMRMIDVAHAWAPRTLENACRTLRRIDKFFHSHQLPSIQHQLQSPPLLHPPIDISIPLFWSMEHYTSTPSIRSQDTTPSWNTGRAQRSALSLFSSFTAAICHPTNAYKDNDNRTLTVHSISPSDNILSRLTASGIGSRLGTESKPSQALTYRHIKWNQQYRSHLLRSQTSLYQQYTLVAAQCVELIAWLGWLRSTELFSLRLSDVELVPPSQGAIYGLPPKIGAIILRLPPSTKGSRNKKADIVIAWKTATGLSLGPTLQLLFKLINKLQWTDPDCFLFRSTTNNHWSSHYFRHNHLYPLLHLQHLQNDPTLRHININSPHDIPHHFYSLHSYRRGAETFCFRKRDCTVRAARPIEIEEHGRWRLKNRGREDMPTHYREPTIEDRIYLTLLCF